jgi:hypothetical protein
VGNGKYGWPVAAKVQIPGGSESVNVTVVATWHSEFATALTVAGAPGPVIWIVTFVCGAYPLATNVVCSPCLMTVGLVAAVGVVHVGGAGRVGVGLIWLAPDEMKKLLWYVIGNESPPDGAKPLAVTVAMPLGQVGQLPIWIVLTARQFAPACGCA